MAFWIAFLASFALAFFLKGSTENPPRRGGLGVAAALVAATAFTAGWPAFFTLRAFWLGAAILLVMGMIDDRWELRPAAKFAIQLGTAILFLLWTPPWVWGGGLHEWLGLWAYPVWLLWIVGITNALNLLDNMDGLTPGVAAVAALGFWVLGFGSEWVLLPLSGALLGGLVWNFPPARIYLGDAGSHLVGFSLAVLPLYGVAQESVLAPVLILVVPIADTSFVTVSRLFSGRSPFQGGKDHLSHRLNRRGMPVWRVVLVFCGFTGVAILCTGLWLAT